MTELVRSLEICIFPMCVVFLFLELCVFYFLVVVELWIFGLLDLWIFGLLVVQFEMNLFNCESSNNPMFPKSQNKQIKIKNCFKHSKIQKSWIPKIQQKQSLGRWLIEPLDSTDLLEMLPYVFDIAGQHWPRWKSDPMLLMFRGNT